jgi:hypothetical protein
MEVRVLRAPPAPRADSAPPGSPSRSASHDRYPRRCCGSLHRNAQAGHLSPQLFGPASIRSRSRARELTMAGRRDRTAGSTASTLAVQQGDRVTRRQFQTFWSEWSTEGSGKLNGVDPLVGLANHAPHVVTERAALCSISESRASACSDRLLNASPGSGGHDPVRQQLQHRRLRPLGRHGAQLYPTVRSNDNGPCWCD